MEITPTVTIPFWACLHQFPPMTPSFPNTFSINYLSDSAAAATLNLPIPNGYGGRVDDVAAFKSTVLAIGANGSTTCNNNKYCQFSPPFLPSIPTLA